MSTFTTGNFIRHDDYMTPKYVWENIKDYIPKDKVIWESFYGDGKSGEYLRELGFDVIHEKIDFFEEDHGEIIVSNPPFTKKKEVFTRLKQLGKPFIMICPSSMLNTKYIRELFANDDRFQIIVPCGRINFVKLVDGEVPDEWSDRCNFDCLYYCWKIGLDRDITWLV